VASYAFALPIVPGQEDANRRFAAELTGSRRADFEASRRRMGLTAERVWQQSTPQGTISVVYLEGDDLGKAFQVLATSRDPFDRWWHERVVEIHGVDLRQPLPGPPNEQLIDWSI
jgi:hypothetical protein